MVGVGLNAANQKFVVVVHSLIAQQTKRRWYNAKRKKS